METDNIEDEEINECENVFEGEICDLIDEKIDDLN